MGYTLSPLICQGGLGLRLSESYLGLGSDRSGLCLGLVSLCSGLGYCLGGFSDECVTWADNSYIELLI